MGVGNRGNRRLSSLSRRPFSSFLYLLFLFPTLPSPFEAYSPGFGIAATVIPFFCPCHFFLVFLLLMIVHLVFILYDISSSLLFLNSSTKSLTSQTRTLCFGIPYRNQSRKIIISVSNHSCQNVPISAVPPWVKILEQRIYYCFSR